MRFASLCAAVALTLSLPALAATDPSQFLVRIGEAARGTTYQGVIIYRGEDMLETLRVTHRAHNGTEHERVQALTGDPREILKQDNKVMLLLPKDRKLTLNLPTPKALFPTLSAERLQQIREVYRFEDLGKARVAGRRCDGLAITPRDQYRYGYEIWADEDTAVPLKVSLIGRDGAVLEQMMFTEIEYPKSIPDSAFQATLAPGDNRQVVRMVENGPMPIAPPPPNGLQFERLPPGFRISYRDVRPLPNGGSVEHLMLSDGLSAISIFSTHRDSATAAPAPSAQRVSQMGAVHAYRRVVGGYQLTVVGEAPRETVRMIGDGARPAGQPAVSSAQPVP